jgi:flavin reductase (DIM6/NTAB) family NADH-FMN oxidoreductase RutF
MEKIKLGPQPLLYPMPALLVGANVNEKPNLMTAAWCGIASHEPPAVSVALHKSRYTLKGIKTNGTFSINVPSSNMAKKVDYCGLYSGKDNDKSQIFKIFYGTLKTAPLVQECSLNLECRVIHSLDMGSHNLVVGEIIETYITDNCMSDGKADPGKIDPLIFIPGTREYHCLGEAIAPAFKTGRK